MPFCQDHRPGQDTETAKLYRELFFFHKTISVCQGHAVWPRTSPYNTQSEAGRGRSIHRVCVCVVMS